MDRAKAVGMRTEMNLSNGIRKNNSFPKFVKDFHVLSHRVLHYANQGVLRIEFQQEVSKIIMDFSGCDAVELWVKEHGNYFRSELKRGVRGKFFFKVKTCLQNAKGKAIPDREDRSNLFPLFNRIIHGQINSPQIRSVKKKGKGLHESDDYSSFLITPIREDHGNVGLLELKSVHLDYFSKDDLKPYEDFSRSLGIALAHCQAQGDLRERVKELTCLYGIARLDTQSSLSLGEILQGIVELLPPAWLYPEIAHARIMLNGDFFSTKGFHEGQEQQRADILIGGQCRGSVEVTYLEEKPELDEGPFLREERGLLDTVAREISNIIMGKQAEQDKANLEEQVRHADRLATIGQLAAGVAHELNEPLGSILGFAQLAQKCPGLPPQAERDIEKILNASLYARDIVRKLLIFAREVPPQKIKVNLNQSVEEALNFFRSRFAKEGIELICSLSPDLPDVDGDPSQLNQVIINLMVNALQAMPHGGDLRIQTLPGENQVSLIIKDTGVGMSEEVLKKIFTPFFTTKEVGHGTGLGLPVAHGIILSHGGSIKVKSRVGQGTRFEIRLPIEETHGKEG